MTADIMAPPPLADIGRGAGKIGLEMQGCPTDHAVSIVIASSIYVIMSNLTKTEDVTRDEPISL